MMGPYFSHSDRLLLTHRYRPYQGGRSRLPSVALEYHNNERLRVMIFASSLGLASNLAPLDALDSTEKTAFGKANSR